MARKGLKYGGGWGRPPTHSSAPFAGVVANSPAQQPPGPPKGVPASERYGNSATGPNVQPPIGGPPLDPAYEAYALSAGRNLSLSEGEGAYQRGQLEQTYGYGASGAANPYSRAALLEESYKRSKLGTTNSMASAGQLYSGAYGRQQGENDRQYSIASDANRRGFDAAIHGVNYNQASNAAAYGVGLDDEKFKTLLRSLGLA